MHEARKPSLLRRSAAAVLATVLAMLLWIPQAWAEGGERELIPVGRAVGIKLFADGVLVVSTSRLDGRERSPAESCGLKEGDVLLCLNGQTITSTEHLQAMLQEQQEAPLTLTVRRGGKTLTVETQAAACDDGVYRLGAWIRDSMAGIGTLTYVDPATGRYGALGHGITDVDTQVLMPLSAGSIMETAVKAVKRGERGDPGELKGDFSQQRDVGTVQANTEAGIFGAVADMTVLSGERAVPVAAPEEVRPGPATILCTVSGGAVEHYEVEIVRLYPDKQITRNLLLHVTDQRLLDATGGIVQGMSGSPILQSGKFVGAVTHVLVNDPTQGYGIFLENMLSMAP